MNNSNYDDDSFEDELINDFGDKYEDEFLSELESELRPKEERLGMQADDEEYIYEDEDEEIKEKNKKKTKNKKKNKIIMNLGLLFVLLCVIIDGILIGYRLLYKEKIDVKEVLLYMDKPVVYDNTMIRKKTFDHIPVVNINNSSINDINNDINTTYNNYVNNNPDYFRYKYSVNDSVISIVLIYRNKDKDEDNYSYKFKTYNISLISLTLYNEDQILRKYHLKPSKVNKLMKDDFYKKYLELINKNYLDESYSYNRLLMDLELDSLFKNNNYYIENNKLYIYRSYNIYNNKNVTQYFDESSYKFYIK